MAKPIAVTDATFDREVLDSDVPVLVDFWASWCGPCRAIAPVLGELARESDGRLRVAKVNIDENPATTARYGIQSVPTLVLFRRGLQVARLVGAVPKESLVAQLAPHISPPAEGGAARP